MLNVTEVPTPDSLWWTKVGNEHTGIDVLPPKEMLLVDYRGT